MHNVDHRIYLSYKQSLLHQLTSEDYYITERSIPDFFIFNPGQGGKVEAEGIQGTALKGPCRAKAMSLSLNRWLQVSQVQWHQFTGLHQACYLTRY